MNWVKQVPIVGTVNVNVSAVYVKHSHRPGPVESWRKIYPQDNTPFTPICTLQFTEALHTVLFSSLSQCYSLQFLCKLVSYHISYIWVISHHHSRCLLLPFKQNFTHCNLLSIRNVTDADTFPFCVKQKLISVTENRLSRHNVNY